MAGDEQRRPATPRIMLTFEHDRRDGLFDLTVRHGYPEGSPLASQFEQMEDQMWRRFRAEGMTRFYQAGKYPATNIPEMYEADGE